MLIIALLYLLLPAIQLAFFLSGQMTMGMGIPTAEIINYAASIGVVHWLTANIILGAKIPLLQQVIPYDKRVRLHIYASAGIALGIGYHALYKLGSGYELDLVTMLLITIFAFLFSASLLWIPVPGFIRFRKRILEKLNNSKDPEYNKSKKLHSLIILALSGLVAVHIINSGLLGQVRMFSVALYVLLFATAIGSYLLSFTRAFKTGAEVVTVNSQEGILTLTLAPDRKMPYRSGQFAFIELEEKNMPSGEHPFSFLSSHAENNTPAGNRHRHETVQFAARIVGPFTSAMSLLKPGDRVRIRGAFGNFRPAGRKDLCLIGSGIGIVPLISIVKELHARGEKRKITVFLSVAKRAEVPDLDGFIALTDTMKNLTLKLLVYEEDRTLFSKEYFDANIPEKKNSSYYLCSSPFVRKIIVGSLGELGVRKTVIHFEAFSFG